MIEDIRKNRRKQTQEFFTPQSIVDRMCDKISEDDWKDPNKNFLEPSFGNGNFVIEILKRKLSYNPDWRVALEHIYGVELMEDNVEECKQRILDFLNLNEEESKEASQIMNNNLVCSDFFKWDFENWKAI